MAAGGGLPARARRPARRRPCGTGHGHRRVHGRGVADRSGRPPGTERNRVARCASSERAGRTTDGRASRTQLRRLLQRAHARVRAGGAALAAGPRTVRAGTGTYPAVRQGLDPLPAHRRGGHRRQRRQSRAGRCSASHVLAAVDGRLGARRAERAAAAGTAIRRGGRARDRGGRGGHRHDRRYAGGHRAGRRVGGAGGRRRGGHRGRRARSSARRASTAW